MKRKANDDLTMVIDKQHLDKVSEQAKSEKEGILEL